MLLCKSNSCSYESKQMTCHNNRIRHVHEFLFTQDRSAIVLPDATPKQKIIAHATLFVSKCLFWHSEPRKIGSRQKGEQRRVTQSSGMCHHNICFLGCWHLLSELCLVDVKPAIQSFELLKRQTKEAMFTGPAAVECRSSGWGPSAGSAADPGAREARGAKWVRIAGNVNLQLICLAPQTVQSFCFVLIC